MAPDLAPNADPPPVPLGSILFAFVRLVIVTAVLVLAFWTAIRWLNDHHYGSGAVMAASAVYCALVMGLVLLWSRNRTVRALMTPSEAAKRYRKRLLAAASAYMAVLLIAIYAKIQFDVSGLAAYAVALLVAAPVIGMIAAKALYLREEADEVERAIMVESSMWGIAGVMAFATAWGFLELFAAAPHMPLWALFPMWAVLVGFANLIVRRRYR